MRGTRIRSLCFGIVLAALLDGSMVQAIQFTPSINVKLAEKNSRARKTSSAQSPLRGNLSIRLTPGARNPLSISESLSTHARRPRRKSTRLIIFYT